MSEETLRAVLDRLSTDETFRNKMRDNWQEAIGELDLTPTELAALSTQDEDALRRLVGAEVTGYSVSFYTTAFICSWLCFCPLPGITHIDTPQSRRDCGTGQCVAR